MALNDRFNIPTSVEGVFEQIHKHPAAMKDILEKAAQETFMLVESAATAKGWDRFKHNLKGLFNWEGYSDQLEAAKFINRMQHIAAEYAEQFPNVQGVNPKPVEKGLTPELSSPQLTPTGLERAYGQTPALRRQREVELTDKDRELMKEGAQHEAVIVKWIRSDASNALAVKHLDKALTASQVVQRPNISTATREATLKEMKHHLSDAESVLKNPSKELAKSVGVGIGI